MEIIIGETAGFCFGVKRAIEKTIGQTNTTSTKPIYCLGELVHNNQVIEKLNKLGINTINNLDEINEKEAKIIIRAHGVAPNIYEEAESKDFEIVDCTCPYVERIHKIVREHSLNGEYVFVVGDKKHAEVIGTYGYCGENGSIISDKEDIELAIQNLEKSNCCKLLIVAQTTFNKDYFKEITDDIIKIIDSRISFKVENTICNATEQRQNEVEKIARQVNCMIIIGGKNSSNTKKLFEISQKYVTSYFVENAEELDVQQVKKQEKVGIMAGASTPQETIQEVKELLMK